MQFLVLEEISVCYITDIANNLVFFSVYSLTILPSPLLSLHHYDMASVQNTKRHYVSPMVEGIKCSNIFLFLSFSLLPISSLYHPFSLFFFLFFTLTLTQIVLGFGAGQDACNSTMLVPAPLAECFARKTTRRACIA